MRFTLVLLVVASAFQCGRARVYVEVGLALAGRRRLFLDRGIVVDDRWHCLAHLGVRGALQHQPGEAGVRRASVPVRLGPESTQAVTLISHRSLGQHAPDQVIRPGAVLASLGELEATWFAIARMGWGFRVVSVDLIRGMCVIRRTQGCQANVDSGRTLLMRLLARGRVCSHARVCRGMALAERARAGGWAAPART